MLVEGGVLEAQGAVVLAGADGGDDGEVGEAGAVGSSGGLVDEAVAEAQVLGFGAAVVAEGEGGAVDVDFADQGTGLELG